MNGQTLISRVRRFLRDLGENTLSNNINTLNSKAGQFWSDFEILTALNVSQDFLVNKAILTDDVERLSMLVVRGDYLAMPLSPAVPFIDLPNNYLHYINGKVGVQGNLHIARIYFCSDVFPYLHVKHDAIYIAGNKVAMNFMGNWNVGGILNYYKRPTKIVAGDFDNSFIDRVYYEDIARYASAFLGTKEIHTQRDYKNYKQVTDGAKIKPKPSAVPNSLER